MSQVAFTNEVDKKRHLVRTTYRLIAEKGFCHLTLQDVADRARVSKGIILYYFESKEALFLEVLDWLVAKIDRHIRVEVSKASNPQEKIAAYVNAMFVSIEANREFYKVYLDFMSQSLHHNGFRSFNLKFYDQCRQLHDQVIGEAIDKGVCRQVPIEESAIVVRSLIDGMGIRWLYEAPDTFHHYRQAALNAVFAYLDV
jgi:AcrR family transcriptional regulator